MIGEFATTVADALKIERVELVEKDMLLHGLLLTFQRMSISIATSFSKAAHA